MGRPGKVRMQDKISPVTVGIVIAIVVVVVIALGYKLAFTQHGIAGKPPASATNPNGYIPPPQGATTYSQPGR